MRPAAWAGQFYPDEPQELRALVNKYLAAAPPRTHQTVKAIIVPHAGYPYSGPIAGSAFAHFIPEREVVRRIILLGPSHRVAFEGLALSEAQAFTTPLGAVPLDHSQDEPITSLPQVSVFDQAHAYEHSLEVELPFLQVVLREVSVVPLVVGEATDVEIAEVLERLWGGPETRVVVSSDLSHYLPYDAARQMDRATAQAIESLQPEKIKSHQACGCLPVRGLLKAAQHHALRAQTVDLRNSGDTAGSRDRVVGYGAFVFIAGPA